MTTGTNIHISKYIRNYEYARKAFCQMNRATSPCNVDSKRSKDVQARDCHRNRIWLIILPGDAYKMVDMCSHSMQPVASLLFCKKHTCLSLEMFWLGAGCNTRNMNQH